MPTALWGGSEELVQWPLSSLLWHGGKCVGIGMMFTFVINAYVIPLDWHLQALCN
jgi:hypothetical protein